MIKAYFQDFMAERRQAAERGRGGAIKRKKVTPPTRVSERKTADHPLAKGPYVFSIDIRESSFDKSKKKRKRGRSDEDIDDLEDFRISEFRIKNNLVY